MKSQNLNYQIIAITTGLILLGSTVLGSAPAVFADDDRDEKWKKLKDLIEKWKKKKKCPEKKKYNGVCDNKKPRIDITSPKKKERVPGSTVIITGTASDSLSGIDKVLVKVNRHSYQEVDDFDPNTGEWKITKELRDGWKLVVAKAIDNVGNTKRDYVFFKVV